MLFIIKRKALRGTVLSVDPAFPYLTERFINTAANWAMVMLPAGSSLSHV